MIVVHLYLSVSHANRTKIVDAVRSVHGPISVQPGCRKFSLFCDVDNDDALILVEEWDSHEALQKHIQSEDFRVILSLIDHAEKEPEFAIHEVSNTSGLEFLDRSRTHQ